ncbi:hypothetical protein [Nocardia sp. NPDC004260]
MMTQHLVVGRVTELVVAVEQAALHVGVRRLVEHVGCEGLHRLPAFGHGRTAGDERHHDAPLLRRRLDRDEEVTVDGELEHVLVRDL